MDLLLWFLAIPVTVAVSYFFFRKSGKSLSFYLLVDDQPLSKVDAAVRERLSIVFSYPEAPNSPGMQGPENRPSRNISDLHHLQVVLYNSGVKAITFTEAPTIQIPWRASILDASVIYQMPGDLGASLDRLPVEDGKDQTVRLAVRMLNKGEFAVIKFLLSEAINAHDLKMHLLAEELDRSIAIKKLPAAATKPMLEEASVGATIFGVLCMVLAASTGALASSMLGRSPLPSIWQVGVWGFIKNLSLVNVVTLASFISVFMLALFGVAAGFGVGVQPMFRRHRIVLPPELRPPG